MAVSLTQCSFFTRLCVSGMTVAIISGLALQEGVSGKPSCPAGQFRNASANPSRCSPCATCPINHIVRKPCNRQNDTVCGPFYEFEFFNQRQQRTGQPDLADHRTKLEERLINAGGIGEGKDGDHTGGHLTTSNSPEEASTVRCGQPQWRVLCYGLVATLVIVVSLALSAVALFSYCRANAKTSRLSEMSGVIGPTDDDDPEASTTTIIVNRDVRHLEEQLFHNQRRKAFLRWLFGSASAADRLFSSNDYLDERHRRHFLLMLDGSPPAEPGGDTLALQPYPGMISTSTARTDHNYGGLSVCGPGEQTTVAEDRRRDQSPVTDEVQVDDASDQGTNNGERSLLIPQGSKRQPDND